MKTYGILIKDLHSKDTFEWLVDADHEEGAKARVRMAYEMEYYEIISVVELKRVPGGSVYDGTMLVEA